MPPAALGPGRLDALPRFTRFRRLVDALRDACTGSYATTRVLHGVLVAVVLAAAAVTVGTPVFRRAGA
ncbi:hypothetical protein ACH4RG_09045 [Streptomyces sp. NPDC021019]|uniref:hypothetical protein n=1 Tax=Streptomyces sp. NPDC021019 TaxID=3365108 RepID=UPI0037AA2C34